MEQDEDSEIMPWIYGRCTINHSLRKAWTIVMWVLLISFVLLGSRVHIVPRNGTTECGLYFNIFDGK